MKRKILVSLALVLLFALLAFAMVSAGDDAAVYVGHGIPGDALGLSQTLPVDVSLSGLGCLELDGLTFGEFAGPLDVAPGTYTATVFLADGASTCTGTPVITATATFSSSLNYTVFAHLDADGDPTATVFENDLSPIVPGSARLTVRHTAAAPAVDIALNRGWGRGRPISASAPITGLVNTEEAGPLDIRPGAYQASLFASEEYTDTAVADPFDFVLEPFKSHIAYAVGGLESETFTVIAQVIEGLEKDVPPRPVPPVPPAPPVMPELPVP
jgi:hypothetical protein